MMIRFLPFAPWVVLFILAIMICVDLSRLEQRLVKLDQTFDTLSLEVMRKLDKLDSR